MFLLKKGRGWLFTVVFLLPFLAYLFITLFIFLRAAIDSELNLSIAFWLLAIVSILALISQAIYFIWLFQITKSLSEKYKINYHKIPLILSLLILLLFYLILGFLLMEIATIMAFKISVIGFATIALIILAFLYIVFQAAYTIKRIANKNIFTTFLQFLFFPIGIWFIQPTINDLALKSID